MLLLLGAGVGGASVYLLPPQEDLLGAALIWVLGVLATLAALWGVRAAAAGQLIDLDRAFEDARIRLVTRVFVAILAAFGGLLAASLVAKQNELLETQNRLAETQNRLADTQNLLAQQRDVQQVFLELRTRYDRLRDRLPDADTRRQRLDPEEPLERQLEGCERRALEKYWMQVFLEWYLVKRLPGEVEEKLAADPHGHPEGDSALVRGLLWRGFYEPAIQRSLEQPLMVQALRSMLGEMRDLFGGRDGEFESEMAYLYGRLERKPCDWPSLDDVQAIPGFKVPLPGEDACQWGATTSPAARSPGGP